MKAAIYEQYGPPEVLKIAELPKPIPKDNEVLVKIVSTTVSAGDCRMRSLNVPGSIVEKILGRVYLGIRGPKRKVLGMQASGVIEEVGSSVSKFNKGDEVYATTGMKFGGYAEYRCFKEDEVIALKPKNMTFEEAAAVPTGGIGALALVRKGEISDGKKVLVYGASGSVGTFAVQLAKNLGGSVTAVCSSANHQMVRDLGAENAIDYTKEDFAMRGDKYDCIIDAVGKISKSDCGDALKQDGKFISMHKISYKERAEDLDYLRELVEEGAVKSEIDKVYPLEDIVEAHTYVDKGHKKGNVVVRI